MNLYLFPLTVFADFCLLNSNDAIVVNTSHAHLLSHIRCEPQRRGDKNVKLLLFGQQAGWVPMQQTPVTAVLFSPHCISGLVAPKIAGAGDESALKSNFFLFLCRIQAACTHCKYQQKKQSRVRHNRFLPLVSNDLSIGLTWAEHLTGISCHVKGSYRAI